MMNVIRSVQTGSAAVAMAMFLSGCTQSIMSMGVKSAGLHQNQKAQMAGSAYFLAKHEQSHAWHADMEAFDFDETVRVGDSHTLIGTVAYETMFGTPSYGPYRLIENATGKTLWSFGREKDVRNRYKVIATVPLIVIEYIDITDEEQTYYIVDPQKGDIVRKLSFDDEYAIAFSTSGDLFFAAQKRGTKAELQAFDMASGGLLWEAEIPAAVQAGFHLKEWNGKLYCFADHLFAMDAKAGSLMWKMPLALSGGLHTPYFTKEAMLLPYDDGTLVKVDYDGKQRWSSDLGTEIGSVTVKENVIVLQLVGDVNSTLVRIGLSDGRIAWKAVLDGYLKSAVNIKGGYVASTVQSNKQSHLYTIALENGKTVHKLPLFSTSPNRLPDQLFTFDEKHIVVVQEPCIASFEMKSGEKVWEHKVIKFNKTSDFYSDFKFWKDDLAEYDVHIDDKQMAKANQHSISTSYSYEVTQTTKAKRHWSISGPEVWKAEIAYQQGMTEIDKSLSMVRMHLAAIELNDAIAKAMDKGPKKARAKRIPFGLRLAKIAHENAIQGYYFVREYSSSGDESVSGFIVVDMRNGRWIDITTSPEAEAYRTSSGINLAGFSMPVLSQDGAYVITKGFGLDSSFWREVELGVARTSVRPSVLGYKVDLNALKPANAYYRMGGYGFIDRNAQMQVPAIFGNTRGFKEGMAAIAPSASPWTEEWGFIDKSGNEVVKMQYEKVSDFSEGLAVVIKEEKSWFIDKTGAMQFGRTFKGAGRFKEGVAPVVLGEHLLGFIDKKGKVVAEFNDAYCISEVSESRAVISHMLTKEGKLPKAEICPDEPYEKLSYIDTNTWEVLPREYYWAMPYSEGLALVRDSETKHYMVIDKNGKTQLKNTGAYYLTSPELRFLDDFPGFRENLLLVGSERYNPLGYINHKGELVITFESNVDCITAFFEDRARANGDGRCYPDKGKWGYLDKQGRFVIPPKYTNISNFSENTAVVQFEDGKYGFIDKNGKELFAQRYMHAKPFSEGLAPVKKIGKTWYVDGKEL